MTHKLPEHVQVLEVDCEDMLGRAHDQLACRNRVHILQLGHLAQHACDLTYKTHVFCPLTVGLHWISGLFYIRYPAGYSVSFVKTVLN